MLSHHLNGMGSRLRGVGRLLGMAVWLLRGLWTLRGFGALTPAQRQHEVRAWAQAMLRTMGVEVTSHGEAPTHGPLMVVSNHLSWLDIVVINAVYPCRFISKAEVKAWPLIGRLVAASGTLFIQREQRRDALRVMHEAVACLKAGDVLCFFPEGTTSDGQTVLPFHANLLQAPLAADAPVLPLALRYSQSAPLFIGDATLVGSMWATVCATGLQAHLHWGLPEAALGRDRRTWGTALRAEVARLADVPLATDVPSATTGPLMPVPGSDAPDPRA